MRSGHLPRCIGLLAAEAHHFLLQTGNLGLCFGETLGVVPAAPANGTRLEMTMVGGRKGRGGSATVVSNGNA